MTGTVRADFFTRRGNGRARLEDALFIGPLVVTRPMHAPMHVDLPIGAGLVAAVFDGMGGHAEGHRASSLAAIELLDLLAIGPRRLLDPVPPAVDAALEEAGRRIVEDATARPERASMGTTVAGCTIDDGGLRVFNVGDSRVYLSVDGYLCPHTLDHVGPSGGLTQALGARLREITPHLADAPARAAPVALVCTDGLYRCASDAELETALQCPDPIAALWDLAQRADDDVAVIVIDGRHRPKSVTPADPEGCAETEPEPTSSEDAHHVIPAHRPTPWQRLRHPRRSPDPPR